MKRITRWGKGGAIAVVLVLALLAGSVAAVAAPGDATRGEYAALLAEKAGIPAGNVSALPADVAPDAAYAGALAGLVENGVMAGYPDGTMRPDEPVTGVQAAVMAGRALGLPATLNIQGAAPTTLTESHWAYGQVAWMSEYGLTVEGNITEPLTADAARDFLNKVFGADQQALDIVLKSMDVQKDIKAFSLEGTMVMNMVPRPGISEEDAQALQGMQDMTSTVQMDFVMPDRMRQVITMNVPGMGEIEIDQYLVGSKIYQKLVNPETAEVMWQYMNLPFDIEALLAEQTPGFQESMLQKFNYKYLGTANLNGQEVHKIGYYGKVNDMAELGGLMPQAAGDDAAMGQLLAQTAELISSISLWGITYVGVEDGLSYGDKTGALIGYGEAVPIATAEMSMEISKYNYDPEITVELPEEAKDAVEIVLPN